MVKITFWLSIILFIFCLGFCLNLANADDYILTRWIQIDYNENFLVPHYEWQSIEQSDGSFKDELVTVHKVETKTLQRWIPKIGAQSQDGIYAIAPCQWSNVELSPEKSDTIVKVICPKSTRNDIAINAEHIIIEDKSASLSEETAINNYLNSSLILMGKTQKEIIETIKSFKAKKAVVIPR
jgi:hypothetical protein